MCGGYMTKYIESFIIATLLFVGFIFDSSDSSKSKIYYDNVSYSNNVILNNVDGLEIDYCASLDKPGDYYEIYFDMVNETKYDFYISNIDLKKDDNHVHYELRYDDGYDVNTGDIIKTGEKKRVRYKVLYKRAFIEEYNFDTNFSINFEMI